MIYLRKNADLSLGPFVESKKAVSADLYLNIYDSLFESHLSFGISVWGVSIKKSIK